MNLKIKICGITRAEDGELALALGADYVGMICYEKSPRAVDAMEARQLCNTFPPGKRVFVDVNTGTHELENFGDMGFDKFQIHCAYDMDIATVAAWSGIVGRENLWLAPKWPPGEPFPQLVLEFCDTVLVDTFHKDAYGGTGETGDWGRFADLLALYPHKEFILAGGLNPGNISDAIRESGAHFVDVNSGVEREPGLKDADKLRELFRILRPGSG